MWLTYDIGTTSTKAALIDAHGRITATTEHGYKTHSAGGGVVEQNAPDWWEAVREVTRSLDPQDVTGIALTGQMQNVILLDDDGNLTHPVILYSDMRAHAQAEQYVKFINVGQMRRLTANKQGEGADGLPAKLLWLAQEKPQALERATHLLLGAADYIVYRMTGEFATDTTTASATGLMNMSERAPLSKSLLPEAIHPAMDKLPTFLPGGVRVGLLTDAAASTLGLPAGLPVHVGPGDAGAITLGAGSGKPGTAYAYLGTSGWVGFSAMRPAPFSSGVITIAHPSDRLTIQVAPLLTAGGNLDRGLAMLNSPDYDTLLDSMPDDPVGVIYLPYLNGERSPFSDPLARAAFIGIGPEHDSGTLARAILTGVAYGYRHALDALTDAPLTQITITGGGTRSAAWMQIFADVFGIEVRVADDPESVGVRGAVAAATGRAVHTPIAETYTPSPDHQAFYAAQYRVFRRAYPALKDIFADLP